MGFYHRPLKRLGAGKMALRLWRVVMLTSALACLFLIPMFQLRDHATTTYYKHYLYDHLSKYLDVDGVYQNTLYQQGNEANVHPHWNFSAACEQFPATDDILLVMKTGATEVHSKLPTQLLTAMQCLPDFLVFSDLEQQIGKYHIYNALDRVDEALQHAQKEFELYQSQLLCPISHLECTDQMKGGWDLDKYKFLNLLVRSWEMRPGRKWYVFAEADTYIFWQNLVQFLRNHVNWEDPLYIGSVAMANGRPFAHGGSGYVMSGTLVQNMVQNITNLAAKYDQLAPHHCCGDVLMAMAVEEAGSKVKQAHPMFNGEKPNTLPFGPGHWCEPLLTMHHMNPEEVSSVWQYEQTRTNSSELIQIKDIHNTFFAPHLTSRRKGWNNLSDDKCFIAPDEASQNQVGKHEQSRQMKEEYKNVVQKHAHESAAACALVCESSGLGIQADEFEHLESITERHKLVKSRYDEKLAAHPDFAKDRSCFQWRYQHGACCIAKSFKLGKPHHHDKIEDKMTSGWFVNGIKDWIDAQGECAGVRWRRPV